MRIAVFGAGGVGGYFGGKLAQAGEEVIFIARGAHLAAIRHAGLTIESAQGRVVIQPARAESEPAAVGPVDVVLVGVKAWQVPEAAEAIRPLVGPQTIVIPLENGVEASDQLAAVLGERCVAGGLCRISSRVDGPGRIHHMGIEPFVAFNWADGHADPRLEALRDAFTRVGVKAVIPADIAVDLWLKFLFITAISGVGSLTRAPAGVMRSIPQTRRLLEDSIAETGAVARARGVALPPAAEADTLRFIDGMPPATTSSMQRDIAEGHPSELEMQNGAVVRLGQAAGVPTPTHAFIYAALLPLEERARGKVTF